MFHGAGARDPRPSCPVGVDSRMPAAFGGEATNRTGRPTRKTLARSGNRVQHPAARFVLHHDERMNFEAIACVADSGRFHTKFIVIQ